MPAYTSAAAHTFHIPIMGTGFTIDTPLKVAKYGISSSISLVDDVLIEQMRKFHCQQAGEPYEEILKQSEDSRASRITAYLNLVDRLVQKQVVELQNSPFEKGSDITKYYEMLPDDAPLKQQYLGMLKMSEGSEKSSVQDMLRSSAVPGSIDVNIMTKLDKDRYQKGEKLPAIYSDAMSALRGFAESTLSSSMIFSAGINKRLYRYMTEFKDFFPDQHGKIKKQIILKVSDHRSSEIQGRFLAKLGLWASEYRIESGLNCGGHAFASKGFLLGVVLAEFKQKKKELLEKLTPMYRKALSAKGGYDTNFSNDFRITVQGGVGTAEEHQFLLKYFGVDSVGWGTPFMLVPEATRMDNINLRRIAEATTEDIFLSDASPLGVPFWNLRTSSSEEARRERIKKGKPGSPCPKGFVGLSTEFTKRPICIASRAYQKLKLKNLEGEIHSVHDLGKIEEKILAKSCICHDLAGNATLLLGIDPDATSAVCCGPGIVDFSKIATLQEMVDHIYGRLSLLTSSERPHMFIKELSLYIDYLRKELDNFPAGLASNSASFLQGMRENLFKGIEFYQTLSGQLVEDSREMFLKELKKLKNALEPLVLEKAEA
ncbi:MAG TPA: hypothetical protein EYG88_07595 [Desulfocapsa sulfexigens]|nr:hypothetical protein [Desulfocapsa sulfexigens]